jgi:hypothetical protein
MNSNAVLGEPVRKLAPNARDNHLGDVSPGQLSRQ